MSRNLISPRHNSLGEYKTYSIASTSSLTPSSSPMNDLPSSSLRLANIKVTEFIMGLPTKSWLGKHVYDAVYDDDSSDKTKLRIADTLWKTLIQYEEALTLLKEYLLTGRSYDSELESLKSVLEKCWIKCCNILELSASELITMNPSYLRSSAFSSESFIKMTIVHSYMNTSFRNRWARAVNLMLHSCRKAGELMNDGIIEQT